MSQTIAAALRTTYWVPQMGSKFARSAWGTKRKVRAAAPRERAGIERPPVAARLPTPANPFNRVLRSIELSQAPNEVKRASQTDGDQPPLLASGMPARPARAAAKIRSEKAHLFERSHQFTARLSSATSRSWPSS